MLDELEDAHTQGRDNYPGSVLEAYSMILHRKDLGRSSAAPTVPRYAPTPPAINDVTFATVGAATVDNESLTFVTNGADVLTPTPGTQRRGVQCWRCGRHGHGKPDCTETVHTDETMLRPRIAHQLLLAAHERYDDDEMFEMRFDDTEQVTDFSFMNVGIERNELSDDESVTGACTICGRFGPTGTMCMVCEDQGGIYDGNVAVPTGVCLGCGGTGDLGEYCSQGCVIRSRYISRADVNAMCGTCEREEMGRIDDDCSDCGDGAFGIHPDAMEHRVARYAERTFGPSELGARVTGQGYLFLNRQPQKLPANWILLDNQSTVNVFSNRDLLRNIRKVQHEMVIRCNAGVTKTRMMGDLPGYDGPVWYNPDGIANILSLSDVEKYHHVSYVPGCFQVREFNKSRNGLFFMVAKGSETAQSGTTMMAAGAIETVDDKKSSYTARSYSRAVAARKFQDQIGRPPLRNLLEIIDKNLVVDCPITREDVMAAEDIFGTNLGSLKGKTPRSASTPVNELVTAVPPAIMERCTIPLRST
jgi:hypothetical protein